MDKEKSKGWHKLDCPKISYTQLGKILHSISNVTTEITGVELKLKDRKEPELKKLGKKLSHIRRGIGKEIRNIYSVINDEQNRIVKMSEEKND